MSNRRNTSAAGVPAAVEETLKLYHAWLGYLLMQQQTDTLRVKVEEIRRALDRFTCTATREGDEYVIRLQAGEEVEHDGHQGSDA